MGRPQFLDIALLYALINFVSTIAILKYLQYGDLGVSGRTSDTATPIPTPAPTPAGRRPAMTMAVDIASWLCLVAGALLCLSGGIGMIRFPDVYARSHAAGVIDTGAPI